VARAEDAAPVSATAAPSLASHKSGSTSTDPSPAAEAGPAVVQEKYEYQAEVARLMDIIINSLYQKKDIFLRELISNASDALDKIRFLSVGDDKILGEGENRNLEIRISCDRDAKTLTIRDRGIGMTKQDLINNLGTIAKSGTANFAEQLASGAGDLSLIGQFGVGFYSAYLAADKVRVVTKNNNDKQHIWESSADGTYTVAEDPAGDTLGRGTEITLFLKDDATDYAIEDQLRKLIKKYSEFITFPIHLQTTKTETIQVPVEDEAPAEKKAAADGDEAEDEEVVATEEETKEDKPKTKEEKVTTKSWEVVNEQKALWQRKPKDITTEEYNAFYKAMTKDYADPATWIHFNAEGEVEFRAILFIPSVAPHDLYDNYYHKSSSLRLYVRKVLISDEFETLMPRYLNFIKGLVDSDDMPLNVSREQLQQQKILTVMGKKLVRKALEMIRKLALDQKKALAKKNGKKDDAADKEAEDAEGGKGGEDEPLAEGAETAYTKFWELFGKSIKLGVIEDSSNRSKLAKLLRYRSTLLGKDGGWRSLEEYVAAMKPGQKNIYFIAGESYDAVANSPFLERLQARGLEVLIMTDAIDEYTIQNLPEFDGHRLQSITKEGLTLPGEDKRAKERDEAYTASFKPLADYLKAVYGDKVEKVAISNRLSTSPCVLVTSQYGYSANMERIVKSQAFGDPSKAQYMASKKTLEINPRHPIIAALRDKAEADPEHEDEGTRDLANLLYDGALLNSGFSIGDSKDFSTRLFRLIKTGMSLPSLDLLPELELPPEKEEEAVEDEDEEEGEDEFEGEEGHDEL